MDSQLLGLLIGLAGGSLRACIGFIYKKAKNPKTIFKPYLFSVTLIEGLVAGALLGSWVAVATIPAGISLGLAAAGLSEMAGKTGLHDRLKK